MHTEKKKLNPRDISWLSFNERVLQEAADHTVPLRERVRFLGIFSNNMDEFFRVRVATLKRMVEFGNKANMHLESEADEILDQIQLTVLNQQSEFNRIWEGITEELQKQKIYLTTEKELNEEQKEFILNYYDEEISPNVIPLMIESIPNFPNLNDRSIYLGVVMWKRESPLKKKYAIIEIPRVISRFIQLPSSKNDEHHIMLLEDAIRFNLPEIFSYFGYDQYNSAIFKVTRDAEIDIDNDISTTIIQKIEKGLKNRKKGKTVRFVYDREMDPGLLEFLIRKLNLSKKDNLIPGGRIHNFRNFMDFPEEIFKNKSKRRKPFLHPAVTERRVSDVIMEKDIMIHVPYHSFNPIIDLLREAAIDPDVSSIKITCYRLASQSKIINALINAVRNGKNVTVMLELTARFDEEANLEWKERLEEEGVNVLIGIQNMKIHSKICVIRRKTGDQGSILYGFVGTGNLNEKTARVYADHFLLTSNQKIMSDVNRVFGFINDPRNVQLLKDCTTIIPSPWYIRKELIRLIDNEIKFAHKKKNHASMILKMNSLSDEELINKLYEAAKAGVEIKLIIRGVCSMLTQNPKFENHVTALSIVDEYLEHARIWVFNNKNRPRVYISSADFMTRNLDHRVEVTCPIYDEEIKRELIDILNIQLHDNVKGRWLTNDLSNDYVQNGKKKIRSQVETYQYLYKKLNPIETGSN
jgi:polyphosphate kinase